MKGSMYEQPIRCSIKLNIKKDPLDECGITLLAFTAPFPVAGSITLNRIMQEAKRIWLHNPEADLYIVIQNIGVQDGLD